MLEATVSHSNDPKEITEAKQELEGVLKLQHSHLQPEVPETRQISEHTHYLNTKKKFTNIRLESSLEPKYNNTELQRYLAERDASGNESGELSYETASIAEASTSDFDGEKRHFLKPMSTSSDGGAEMQIFRQSELSKKYDEARELACEMETYEDNIVRKYYDQDLYLSKGKTRSKITFNDLTLEENLNYVKYTLKNSNDAFEIFDQTKEKFQDVPDLAAAIVAKLAIRSNITPRNFDDKVFSRKEYKGMLKQIKAGFSRMDNKQLVDTVFSLGKLHGYAHKNP